MKVWTGERSPSSSPRKTRTRGTGDGARLRHVMREVATGVAVGVGQRHPQLHTVQDGGGRGGHLGMTDARARGHEVQLAGPHHRVHPGAVAMLHLAAEQPTDGLQSGVRMRRHVHPGAASDVVRTVVVGETPRPDQRPLALWQRASHMIARGPPSGTSRGCSTPANGEAAQATSAGAASVLLTDPQ